MIRGRWWLIVGSFGYVFLLAALAAVVRTGSGEETTGTLESDGTVTSTAVSAPTQSLLQTDTGPVLVILGLLLLGCLVSAADLAVRVRRGSTRTGVIGMVAACALGVLAFLALLSAGPLLLPLVILLVLVAQPLKADVGAGPPVVAGA